MLLIPLELTASGRPKLERGELEHAFLDKADIQFEREGGVPGRLAKRHEDGFAVLTTSRIVWVDAASAPSPGASCFLPLSSVESIELYATKFWTQTKLRVRVHLDDQRQPTSGLSGYTRVEEFRLISRHYGNFADQARAILYQRAWEKNAEALKSHPSLPSSPQQRVQYPHSVNEALMRQLTAMGFSETRSARACLETGNQGAEPALQWLLEHENDPEADVPLAGMLSSQHTSARRVQGQPTPGIPGIMGILRREEEIAARNDRNLDEAFQDLRGLMAKAQEMVQMAEKFRGTLSTKGGDLPPEEALDADLQQQLIEIGIASPVTKEMAGALYHMQLSRQLADFLSARMQKAGGMMTLADIFCLFNRARGTELISPDDLLQAVNLFHAIGAAMHLRTFPTGVLVVQSDSHDDNAVCSRIAEMVSGDGLGPSVSATQVAAALSVPLTIAAQHLATAESKAVLCRDDGPEGLRFYRNFFEEVPA